MKRDIQTRKDIELLVDVFYDKVKVDEIIGYFFTEVVKVNWDKHLPRMYDFWENVLFQSGSFTGNPMAKHKQINEQSKISDAHFAQWILLFDTTVDELFFGDNARLIKTRAKSIATIMLSKIN
jgi:hemoglobin